MKLKSQVLAIEDRINLRIQEYNDLVNKPISIELYLDRLAKVREDLDYCVKQLILSFLRTYPKRSGYTYKEICRNLRSEINTSYLNFKKLVEGGLILEKKEKGKKERYMIHPTHLKEVKEPEHQ
ncbi:MAG: hypothetical protein ACFFB5_20930 [Promethearchaeota archaeon]